MYQKSASLALVMQHLWFNMLTNFICHEIFDVELIFIFFSFISFAIAYPEKDTSTFTTNVCNDLAKINKKSMVMYQRFHIFNADCQFISLIKTLSCTLHFTCNNIVIACNETHGGTIRLL